MTPFSLTDLAKIIERDSKDSTYKFALLRGTIDIIQNFHNKRETDGKHISYPMGLMILKWIEYYFPLLAYDRLIPQRHGDKVNHSIAFINEFKDVIDLYPNASDYHKLLYDLKKGIKSEERIRIIMNLIRELKKTISKKPMYHIGSSIGLNGLLYTYEGTVVRTPKELNLNWIIENLGEFALPIEFHNVLSVVGSFVAGTNSIIFKWADFTNRIIQDNTLNTGLIISLLNPGDTERDVLRAKIFYKSILENDTLYCVWTGDRLRKNMHIDHMLPFISLQNNDLWNLLPTGSSINTKKRDAIPSRSLLENKLVKDRIICNWEALNNEYHEQFMQEISISLMGRKKADPYNWQQSAFTGLVDMTDYLIKERGLTPWNYKIH
jgi:hypothetical protein